MPWWIGSALTSVAILAGCGRIGFDQASIDTVPGSDVDVVPASGPFGNLVQLDELDGSGADDPALTADELEIMFSSDRTGGVGTCDVWTSTRASSAARWSQSVGAPVDTPSCESGAFLARDGLALWLGTGQPGMIFVDDLVEARRATRISPWQAPQPLGPLNTTSSESAPTVTADQLTIVFDSARSGAERLWIATRASIAAAWDPPTIVGPLTAGTEERSAHLSADGLTLWFISNELGTQDMWVASRPDSATPFGGATVLPELSSAESEDDPWLSDDGHRIYFVRYPIVGLPTLWTASR